MGIRASIYGIGPFSDAVSDHLQYPQKAYKNTKAGVNIFVYGIFECNSSAQSIELASAFNIDPYDFNQHEFVPSNNVNWEELSSTLDDDYSAEQMQTLAANGFKFYFVPDY